MRLWPISGGKRSSCRITLGKGFTSTHAQNIDHYSPILASPWVPALASRVPGLCEGCGTGRCHHPPRGRAETGQTGLCDRTDRIVLRVMRVEDAVLLCILL